MTNRFKINELIEMTAYFPILGIVGPRQVGKTTLAKLISKTITKPSIYYFYRTHEGAELDLVITRANKAVLGIEFKFSSSPSLTKGSHFAAQDVNAPTNFVITPTGDHYSMTPTFKTCSLSYFLTIELPKFF